MPKGDSKKTLGKKGFSKGQSGNLAGKPKGTKSHKTIAWEQLGDFITDSGAERVKDILTNCTKKEFMVWYPLLLEYFKPKQQRVENTIKTEDSSIEITRTVFEKGV